MKRLTRMLAIAAALVMALCVTVLADEVPADTPIQVMINGELVDFPDAAPQLIEGRTYIPLRAVFNVLGFADDAITWDGATRTATAVKDDLTVAITEGVKSVTVTTGGKTQTIETDAAAYVEAATGRTLVPIRFVAEAAGCNVGWDGAARTAIIDDTAAILAANTETYDLMNQYMAYSKTFSEKKYAVTGDYSMKMEMGADYMAAAGKYEMLMDGKAAQFNTTMNFSGEMGDEDLTAQFPGAVDADLRFDLDQGVYYLHSEALNSLTDVGINGVWFKLDLGAMMDQMSAETGMDYKDLLALSAAAQEMTFDQYLAFTLSNVTLNDTSATTGDLLAAINTLCADSSFKKSGSSYTATMEQDGVVLKLTLYSSGSKVSGYAMELDAAGIMDISASMRDNKMKVQMSMATPAADGVEAMSMVMDMTGKYAVTSKSPTTEPPAGAGVIDLIELMTAQG